ncbi:MAG: hypothetical protein CI947_1669 [Halanaerobium sp.]|nr:MAG: hypothetical protein CI949_2968 [Halanaerobium sp.]PUU89534.1 MAG: hypothetical protein CI947_1669 [Halanaerobium sp.]
MIKKTTKYNPDGLKRVPGTWVKFPDAGTFDFLNYSYLKLD